MLPFSPRSEEELHQLIFHLPSQGNYRAGLQVPPLLLMLLFLMLVSLQMLLFLLLIRVLIMALLASERLLSLRFIPDLA